MAINLKKVVGEKANESLGELVTKNAINTFKGWIPGHVSGIEKECQGSGLAMKRDIFSGEFLCVGSPAAIAALASPQIEQRANISAPVAAVYNSATTNITINNPVTYIIPPLPERRLSPQPAAPPPPAPVGTVPTQTFAEKSSFVQVSIKNGLLGCLLHEPLNATPVVIKVPDRGNFLETAEETQAFEGKKFTNWLLGKANQEKINITGDETADTAGSFTQTGVFLIIKRPDTDSESGIIPLFGTETFQTLIGDYITRNRLQINPVTCLVPMDFKVVETEPRELTVTEILPNITLGGGASELLEKVATTLGVNEFPASLPKTIINKDEGFLANFIAGLDEQVEIKNLTQLAVWFFERFDEVMGQWEIPIQIKDSDPTTPGDQPVGIRLPNLAESQAEQFTMAFQSTVNLDLLINIATRILAEVGQIKQQGFKGYGLTQTLVDYFNYEYSEDAVDMPLSFAPGKDRFDELLKETIQKVAYPEFTDKENFKVTETRLLEMAAIIKALHWRKVDAGGDIKSQIKKSVLARAKQLDDEVKRQQDDLDQFVEEAEKGYPNLPGMPSPGEPYGEAYTQRPIVKRIEE